ncbi:MAG: hypothetical protein AB8B84_02560 [Granulosicoccus sp.]
MNRNIVAAIIFPLVLSACGSGSTSIVSTGALEDEQTTTLTKYDGTYQTFCGVSVFAPISNTSVTVTTIDGNQGKITTFNYTDKGCTVPAVPSQTVMEVSLEFPGGTVDTSRGEADFIDITVNKVTLDTQVPTLAQQQQLAAVSVLSTRYDIIVLQDSALYTGESTGVMDGKSPDTRPTDLSTQPAISQ